MSALNQALSVGVTAGIAAGLASILYFTRRQPRLLEKISASCATASRHGSLFVIESTVMHVKQHGISFEIRAATNLDKKPRTNKTSPFMPPFEPGLFVDVLPSGHRLLLNKFPVYNPKGYLIPP